MSETRRRTELIPVRMTPAEAALLDAVVKQTRARGRGTVLREAFMGRWKVEPVPGGPCPDPRLAAAPEPAQDRPGGFSPAAYRKEAREQ